MWPNNNIEQGIIYCGAIITDCGEKGCKFKYLESLNLFFCNKCGKHIPEEHTVRYRKILNIINRRI